MMIRRNGEGNIEMRVIGGGNGEVQLTHKFQKEELFGKSRLVAELRIAPGVSIGMHDHVADVEVFYMLEGALVSVNKDGSEEPFMPGDSMVTGGGESHSLRNDSGKEALLFAVIAI